jgi:hypothetical protein
MYLVESLGVLGGGRVLWYVIAQENASTFEFPSWADPLAEDTTYRMMVHSVGLVNSDEDDDPEELTVTGNDFVYFSTGAAVDSSGF